MAIIFATGTDEGYYATGIVQKYLQSLQKFIPHRMIVVCQDFLPTDKLEGVEYAFLPSKLVRAANLNRCLQHGEFLTALCSVSDDDCIVFTDSDIVAQRPLAATEEQILLTLGDCEFWLGYNAGPHDTLDQEARRIGFSAADARFPRHDSMPCYNTGIAAARAGAWREMAAHYIELAPLMNSSSHYARQQWLISYIAGQQFSVRRMGYQTHLHQLYPVPPETTKDSQNRACFGGQVVMFWHGRTSYNG